MQLSGRILIQNVSPWALSNTEGKRKTQKHKAINHTFAYFDLRVVKYYYSAYTNIYFLFLLIFMSSLRVLNIIF